MAKQSRRSRSRNNQRKRRNHRKSRRSQRGGGGCSAFTNRNSFQTGGAMLSPYNGEGMLLNQQALVQAQSNGQVEAINDLPYLIPQRGGSRSRWSRRSRRQRGGMEEYSASSLMSQLASMSGTQSGSSRSRRSRRSRRQRGGMGEYSASSLMSQLASMSGTQSGSSRSRRQRGGMSPFADAFATPRVPQGGEMNPQFRTEAMVNPSYGESRGAQA